ncbi:hypothetical protein GU926_08135 [Nibribacter ruber]|uniref:Uncharacterized protein n=1 Tax=Nibribacter ruber TaxID=2698458 RepID=A0A6P1NYE1_9BACT|nr:hypothetical protein [Nibribacter ruber]QHL87404.1 hypothetical protein GU926_08135 [Nibribacter ruber]
MKAITEDDLIEHIIKYPSTGGYYIQNIKDWFKDIDIQQIGALVEDLHASGVLERNEETYAYFLSAKGKLDYFTRTFKPLNIYEDLLKYLYKHTSYNGIEINPFLISTFNLRKDDFEEAFAIKTSLDELQAKGWITYRTELLGHLFTESEKVPPFGYSGRISDTGSLYAYKVIARLTLEGHVYVDELMRNNRQDEAIANTKRVSEISIYVAIASVVLSSLSGIASGVSAWSAYRDETPKELQHFNKLYLKQKPAFDSLVQYQKHISEELRHLNTQNNKPEKVSAVGNK